MKFNLKKLNVTSLTAPIKRVGGKMIFKAKKHSPEILLVAGVGGIVTGSILACKATLKADSVLDEFESKKSRIEEAKAAVEEAKNEGTDIREYTESDQKKDLAIAYRDMIFGFSKLYALPIIIEVGGIACILCSYGIMKKRNLGLIAAYTALDGRFKKYREKVVDKFGEEAERSLRTGTEKKKVFTVSKDENGEDVVKEEKDIPTMDNVIMEDVSNYGRVFAPETTACYIRQDPIYTKAWLKGLETQFNDLLYTRGYVFLSEVYQALGFKITPESIITGWIKDSTVGDNYVSFGNLEPFFASDEQKVLKSGRIVNAYAPKSFYLDFNVDGVIWNLI